MLSIVNFYELSINYLQNPYSIQVLVGAILWRFESSRAHFIENQRVPKLKSLGIFC